MIDAGQDIWRLKFIVFYNEPPDGYKVSEDHYRHYECRKPDKREIQDGNVRLIKGKLLEAGRNR